MNASFAPPAPATLILDFDSTFTTVEALDILAELLSAADPARAADVALIKTLTDQAMSGEISFADALQRRIQILKPTRDDIAALIDVLKTKISASIARNRAVFND
ncbi:MAG: phosphoglycerate dehydrogenase, partial [Asticcacaulis sp.]|nr:phosphoglycerate dehydrogenase [Asticcacaulis sp.]